MSSSRSIAPSLVNGAALCLITFFVVVVLYVGRNLLIPFVVALLIWFMINVLAHVFQKIRVGGVGIPTPITYLLSILAIVFVLTFLVQIIIDNINNVIRAAPFYQTQITVALNSLFERFGMEEPPTVNQIIGQVDFPGMLRQLGFAAAGLIGQTVLITVYLIFLFLEQKFFVAKLRAIAPDAKRQRELERIVARIASDVRLYVGIKTLTSLLTGIFSYVLMAWMGVDFAMFWALLIFLLNFIPTIGSIIATIFPTLLALAQFGIGREFFIIGIGLICIQVTVGNFLEPRLMGQSLNLSPLVIILSLAAWGILWGIPGAFFCVPLTVVIMIILANFENTRNIAILLSGNGEIHRLFGEENDRS